MKKAFYILLLIGIIFVLLSVLFKEFHWQGRKVMETTGVIITLVAMLVYLFALIRNKQISQ